MADSYKWWVTSVVLLGLFMPVVDTNIVNVGLPHMMAAFAVGIDQIKWVVTAYGMAFAIFTMLSHWLRTLFGLKALYLWSTALFTLASVLCGLSWNNESMVAFRVLQAVGGGLMLPTGMTMMTEAFPPEERGKAFGVFGIVIIFGPTLGPTLGGYLVDEVGWRYIFYINLPVGILTFAMAALFIRHDGPAKRTPLDLPGFLMISASLVFLLLALSEGQREGWTSDLILGYFTASGLALVLFILVEGSVAHPLIDLTLFAGRVFSLISILSFIRSVGLFSRIFLLPLFMQRAMGYTAIQTGWLIAPGAAAAGVGMPVVGRLSDRFGPKYFIAAGFVLLTWSQLLYYDLTVDTPYVHLLWPHVVFGIGMACLQAPLMSTAMNVVRRDQIGMVSSLQGVIMQLGGALGVAFLGTMLERLQISYRAHYAETLAGSSESYRRLMGDLQSLAERQGLDPSTAEIQARVLFSRVLDQQALVSAFDDTFVLAGLICTAGIPLVLWLKTRTS